MAGRILVLDDEENYAEMLQDLLLEHGYRVDMATRPERALAQLEEIPYDLVISDYKMPVMDGADLLKKSRELYPGLPFILVSGLMNTPELVKVSNMGVTLVMEKPLDTQAFLDQVSRFSSPLTDEEREQLAGEGQVEHSQAVVPDFPSEPRFFSAQNLSASRFLGVLWTIARKRRAIFIMEPQGSDVELVLKDLSNWRGNDDKLMAEFGLPETVEGGLEKMREVLADSEKSRVIIIRLESLSQIPQARDLSDAVRDKIEGEDSIQIAYLINGGVEQVAEFNELTGNDGVVLPGMRGRPSDVAAYARRFARIATDRAEQKLSAEFTAEAGLALLSYEWPENYTEIKRVIRRAVQMTGDAPIGPEVLKEALGNKGNPRDESRPLASLLKAQQNHFLKNLLAEQGLSLNDICEALNLDTVLQSSDEIDNLAPQINSNGKL
ncbi:MAG: response regulator [Verrucomicrobia bacterium]|jgi:CheY-like chemotaxis protein|nr:response regulator [Verrucomicrobiota bacterium]